MTAFYVPKEELSADAVVQFRDYATELDNPKPVTPSFDLGNDPLTSPDMAAGSRAISSPPEPTAYPPSPAAPPASSFVQSAGMPVATPGGDRPYAAPSGPLVPNQFGDPSLSASEALAACGPAAAVAFARANGRNPSLREALDLAKSVGWTAGGGMNGVGNQKALLDKMGIASELDTSGNWDRVEQTARNNQAVAISTPNHYFVADGFDPSTGKYHVGASGTVFRTGAEWMTKDQITALGGGMNGALYTSGNATQTLTAAESPRQPVDAFRAFTGMVDNVGSAVSGAAEGAKQTADSAVDQFGAFVDSLHGKGDPLSSAPVQDNVPSYVREYAAAHGTQVAENPYVGQEPVPATSQNPLDVLGQAKDAVARPGALLPNVGDTVRDSGLWGPSDQTITTAQDAVPRRLQGETLSPEEQKALSDVTGYVGGMVSPLNATGSRTATAAQRAILEEQTRPITATREAEIARLKLDDFPDWLHNDLTKAAEDAGFHQGQRRGVIPLSTQDELGKSLAESVDIDKLISGSKIGQAFNTEQIRAYKNLVGTQAATVQGLTKQVAEATSKGQATDTLIARAMAEGEKLQGLQRILEGGRAEWGRAGQAFQAPAKLLDLNPTEATSRIFTKVGGRENALKAVEEFGKLTDMGASPVQMANFWAKIERPPPNADEWFRALRYNSMLSGPRTLEVNVAGNGAEIPWRLLRDTGASVLRGHPEEMIPEVKGLWAGVAKGNRAFMETLSQGITTEKALAGDIPRSISSRVDNPAAKKAAQFLEAPGTLLAAADEWANAVAYSMYNGRAAAVTATKQGLKGQAWESRVAELMAEPTAAMHRQAVAAADRMTYKGDMGQFGRALEQIQKVPIAGSILLPFLRTVYHIKARGIDRSPVGWVGTGVDLARGVYGKPSEWGAALAGDSLKELPKGVTPLGERLGDNIMGAMAFTAFYNQAVAGNISGAGPDDPEKRDMLKANGWQPYSVKVGDNWISYSNWGPVADSLSLAAAADEAVRYAKPGDNPVTIMADGMRRSAELVTEQAFLQSVGAVWKGLDDPKRYGGQWLSQTIQSLIPYGSLLNTVGAAGDESVRRPEPLNFEQSLSARLPGLRQNAPEAQDQLGRTIKNQQAGLSSLNPLRVSPESKNDVVTALLAEGVDIGDPPKAIGKIDLTPSEQRTYNTAAGKAIESIVRDILPSLEGEEPDVRRRILQKAVAGGRKQASYEILDSISEEDYQRRLGEGAAKREPLTIR